MADSTQTKSIKGTETEKQLLAAYFGESEAYTRYIYYAQQATKEGYYPVAEIFNQTAANELHHGKIFFNLLQGGNFAVTISTDAGPVGKTVDNLRTAVAGERAEGVETYTKAAKIAEEEGFPEIARHFREIATIEEHHMRRFERYLKQVETDTVWKRDKPIVWRCLVCGFEFEGTEPPKTCPACDHPYQHYMSTDPADN
ncbi:MAG: rubrerythrin family protein [Muribaculaceae bacterium]|nr:rubrerythrin family protein [Muribaculaceae bacterium]